MTQQVAQIITEAFQKIGIVDENEVPSNEQATNGLSILNDMLANEAADGLRLGWFPQTSLTAIAPLRDQDIFGVKLLLAVALAGAYGIDVARENPLLVEQTTTTKAQMTKRSIKLSESDLGELQRPQGGPWGGPNWI